MLSSDNKILEKGRKVQFTSLGCARNLVDTEVMLGIVLRAGYELALDPEEADYLVVNTCGFLEASRQEARDTIEELFSIMKPSGKVIVTGCMVQLHKEELRKLYPNIHYFLGSGDVEKILEAIESGESGDEVSDARSYLEWGEVPRQVSTPKHYAYLKIAEGCKKQCAFCIIPKIKGKLKSKTQDRVIKEFLALLKGGAKEIILIAQDLGDFGKDRKEGNGLAQLLYALTQIEGDFWIRLLYLYPDEITDEIIDIMAKDPRICPYLDMPIQHINDKLLKAMHRKTSKEQIISTIKKLRERLPNIVIRTSLMVGYPGETTEQFNELCQFVKEYQLDNVGIFQYSKEELSHSAGLTGHHSEATKKQRFEKLASVQHKQVEKRSRKYLKQTLKVLIEGVHPDSNELLIGRFYGQCPEVDGLVIINQFECEPTIGEFYNVKITKIIGYDLIGRVLAPIKKPNLLNLI